MKNQNLPVFFAAILATAIASPGAESDLLVGQKSEVRGRHAEVGVFRDS